jgi:AraC-like DNA-binding protein
MITVDTKIAYGMLDRLATVLGSTVEMGILKIPKDKGKGYLRGFLLSNSLSMMIRNCELNEDLLTIRTFGKLPSDRIMISFNNIFPSKDDVQEISNIKELPSVQIGKGQLNFEMFYPSFTKFRSIRLNIAVENLKELVGEQKDHSILSEILDSNQPLLFEEFVSPQLQKVAMEIIENNIPESLHIFYFRLKAEELICLLFAELYKRKTTSLHALNEIDVQMIYLIRDNMFLHLDSPPVLAEMAESARMSVSKIKRLFKQIFGTSIFNYYQNFRMQEAARLLREKKLTVSEVGYQMGFTNLSHFSKVFEEHIGMKPKKYSLSK